MARLVTSMLGALTADGAMEARVRVQPHTRARARAREYICVNMSGCAIKIFVNIKEFGAGVRCA